MRMTFRLSLTRPGSSRVLDVTVDADQGDTAADLATALAEVWLGRPGGTIPGLVVDGRVVAPDTPVGVPPLLDGAGVQLSDDPVATTPGRRPAAAALRLDVVAGPDAGRSYPLTPGRHVVGRDASCDVAVDDPGLSRRHTAVEVSAEGVRAEDLGSTNGTVVDGRPVTAATLTPGTELLLGGSRLAVRTTVDAPPAARTAAGDGTWTVHRSPALARPPHGASFDLPREPLPPAPVRMPWLVMLLPLPVCAVLAFLWGPQLLAFALLGPLMSGGTTWSDRRAGRRRYATERAAYDTERRAVEESVAAALAAERAASAARHPDAAQTLRAALGPTRQLWDRGADDPVVLRLGIGDSPSATVVVDPVSHRPVAQTLMDSPFVLDLSAAGVVGLCGPPRSREALCRTLLGQLAVRHSPADVVLHVVGPAEESSWTRWLPHVERPTGPVASSVAALLRRLDARSGRRDAGRPRDALPVVVLTGTPRPLEAPATADGPGAAATASAAEVPGVRGSPVVDALCTHALEGRCIVVALGDAAADLPPQCRAVVELTPSDRAGRAILTVAGQSPRRFVPDGVDAAWAERLTRALAPLRDPRARAATLPTSVGLAECLAVDVDDPEGLSVAWAADRPGLDAVVGWDRQGPHVVDLVTDGPHALIGGTTGAGKSELLRSLVAGLAARHSPERLSFVLVDYKGGAAFRECADLPHTAAVVTDLDLHLARRALVGLTAELRRREHVLAARGARDIEELNADPGPAGPLPRLVIVVDELKMLVEELPEFVEGLVRLAALGRSLGLHLVLATQRPAGAITADIQANVNLRIALRVRDRLDSEHVIAAPDAALLPDDVPGRAVASTGSGPLLTFQTAHPGATTPR
ncbi:FtsK/SpoIIIE domain-containing protein, partial [Nostocoides japonicum]|uniref:FtsK/SpoIIIE domain-containing protein n=1 Tax=Nostocoides japonicum TaxID=99481 RepID=UPI0012F9B574